VALGLAGPSGARIAIARAMRTSFIETDASNLGKTLPGGKNIQPSVILQDARQAERVHGAAADLLFF
jgi:hypothetical protein